MLVSNIDCDKTFLAIKLVVDLSPMVVTIVEPFALLDPLEEGWDISSVESDFAEIVDDDFVPGLSKLVKLLEDFLFLVCGAHYQHEILGHLQPCSIQPHLNTFYIFYILHWYLLVLQLTSSCTIPDWASSSENRSSSFFGVFKYYYINQKQYYLLITYFRLMSKGHQSIMQSVQREGCWMLWLWSVQIKHILQDFLVYMILE